MTDQRNIKTFTPSECPHCKKEIYVVHVFHQPYTESILTGEEIQEAKKAVLEKMKTINFKQEVERKLAEDWVKNESTMFSMADVEQLIKTMAMSQIEPTEDKPKEPEKKEK